MIELKSHYRDYYYIGCSYTVLVLFEHALLSAFQVPHCIMLAVKEGGNVVAASCSKIFMMKLEEFDPTLPFIHG